jgi:hypothetical protein
MDRLPLDATISARNNSRFAYITWQLSFPTRQISLMGQLFDTIRALVAAENYVVGQHVCGRAVSRSSLLCTFSIEISYANRWGTNQTDSARSHR